jgi:hypothetical protein
MGSSSTIGGRGTGAPGPDSGLCVVGVTEVDCYSGAKSAKAMLLSDRRQQLHARETSLQPWIGRSFIRLLLPRQVPELTTTQEGKASDLDPIVETERCERQRQSKLPAPPSHFVHPHHGMRRTTWAGGTPSDSQTPRLADSQTPWRSQTGWRGCGEVKPTGNSALSAGHLVGHRPDAATGPISWFGSATVSCPHPGTSSLSAEPHDHRAAKNGDTTSVLSLQRG